MPKTDEITRVVYCSF